MSNSTSNGSMMRLKHRFICSIWLLSVFGSNATYVTADEVLQKEQIEKWSAYYGDRAADYRLTVGEENSESLELVKEPVLRWHNPIRTTTHGECFVWTRDGRPVAFCSLFSYPLNSTERRVAHAFNVFTNEMLTIKSVENPVTLGVIDGSAQMQPVPNAPAVAATQTQRLVQMRQIARKFSATSAGTSDEPSRPLRLLAAPVYRYEQSDTVEIDGAIFVFAMGTDPEVVLVLESRVVDKEPRWHFLPARHSHTGLKLSFDGNEVWNYEPGLSESPYLSQHGIDKKPKMLP